MRTMNPKEIALHLIGEDLKYHQMVHQCGPVEVHIEFFPDFATAVKNLLGQGDASDDWEDRYVTALGKIDKVMWGDHEGVQAVAEEVLEALVGK